MLSLYLRRSLSKIIAKSFGDSNVCTSETLVILVVLGLHYCTRAFPSCSNQGYSLVGGARASHCSGFTCLGTQVLDTWASVVVGAWALEHGLSDCGTWAQLFLALWNLPRPGTKPVSLSLAGGFLSTVPPGKSSTDFFKKSFSHAMAACEIFVPDHKIKLMPPELAG